MEGKKYIVGDKIIVHSVRITLEIHKTGCDLCLHSNILHTFKAVVTGLTDDGGALITVDDRGLTENIPLNTPKRSRTGIILYVSGYFTEDYPFEDLIHEIMEEGGKEIAKHREDLVSLEKDFASLNKDGKKWGYREAIEIRRRAANLLNRRSDKTL